MGPLPRAMLGACLSVLRTLLFVTAGLLTVLIVVQQLRGDAEAAPLQLGIAALVMAAFGWASGKAATWVARME